MLGVTSSKQLGLVILSGLAYNEAPSQSMGWFLHWQVPCRGFFLGWRHGDRYLQYQRDGDTEGVEASAFAGER